MPLSLDPTAGRMHDTAPPAGTFTGFSVTHLSTDQEVTFNQEFAVAPAYAGRINVQFGGDSNMFGAGTTNPDTDRIAALARRELDKAKFQTDNIGDFPWWQGGRTTQEWWQDIHVRSANPGATPPAPPLIRAAFQPGKRNILVLMLGTNDVGRDAAYSPYFNGGTYNGVQYAGVRANFTRILKELTAIGWIPIILIPMDLGSSYPNFRILRQWMLHNIPGLGGHLYDVSTDPLIGINPQNRSEYWGDALHLSTKGVARLWGHYIKPAVLANS